MTTTDGLAPAAMLFLSLAAVYLLLNERNVASGANAERTAGIRKPDWRDTDPSRSSGGFEEPRSGTATLKYDRRDLEETVADPLDFTPDIKRSVERLRARVGVRTGNLGAVMQVEWHARRFAMMVYRRLGRDPEKTSNLDARRAADDLTRIRAEIVNAVHAMYVSVQRERLLLEIDEVSDDLMRDTAAYIRAVREVTGNAGRNLYEGGREFPSPWNEAADPNYDMLV